jgi:hypothetical protein
MWFIEVYKKSIINPIRNLTTFLYGRGVRSEALQTADSGLRRERKSNKNFKLRIYEYVQNHLDDFCITEMAKKCVVPTDSNVCVWGGIHT